MALASLPMAGGGSLPLLSPGRACGPYSPLYFLRHRSQDEDVPQDGLQHHQAMNFLRSRDTAAHLFHLAPACAAPGALQFSALMDA